jgi:DNA-binding GntR family transcriptional regulator
MAAAEATFVPEGRPRAQLIAEQLRELIVQGTFSPGQQVYESVLASQLNTSRGTLREGLQRLCQEGILVSKRNRGVFVPELSKEDIEENYVVREAVELAAAQTLLASSQEQVADTCRELKDIIKDMAKRVAASDWQAIARLDMQFHTAFVSGTGNARLIRIYETLAAESRMCILSLELAYPRIDVLVQEHQNILDLLEAGDQTGLPQSIKRHMHKAVEDLTSPREATEITA